MAINFEPAQPLDVNVASAYGANQSFQQALPAIASLYEAGGRLQQQGQIAEADRQTHAQQESARLRQHADLFKYAQDQQVQRDLFESTRGFEMQQQKAELTGWLNSRALSEHEQRRYDAMNNAVAEVYRNDDLSGEEKVNLTTKLRTGIDVYEERQRQASAKLKNEQDTHLMDLHTKQVKMDEDGLKYKAQGFKEKVQEFTDPDTGETFHYYIDPTGKPHPVGAKATTGKAEKPEKPVTRFGDEHGVFSYALAEKEAKARAEAKYPKVGGNVNGEKVTDINERNRAEQYQREIQDLEADHKARHGPASVQGGGGPGGGQERPDPVKKIDTAIDDVKQRKDMLPVQREKLVGAMETLKQIVAVYPDVRTAPPQVQQQAQAAAQFIASVPPPAPAKTSEQSSRELGGAPSNIAANPPPQEPPSWFQRNVVDNIPNFP